MTMASIWIGNIYDGGATIETEDVAHNSNNFDRKLAGKWWQKRKMCGAEKMVIAVVVDQ